MSSVQVKFSFLIGLKVFPENAKIHFWITIHPLEIRLTTFIMSLRFDLIPIFNMADSQGYIRTTEPGLQRYPLRSQR